MRDSPNRPNGIEPAGSRSRSVPVPFPPSPTSDLSLSHPFRTVSFPLRLSLSFPLAFSIHPTDLPLRFGHPPFPSKWRRGRRSPLDSVPLSPAPSLPSPRGSHGPVSLARSAHEHSGSCLVPSTRVALSLCPLPSPRVISHSLALACVRAHISVYTRWTAPGSREKKTRCVQCIYIYIVHVERNYIDPIYTIYISPIVKSIVTSLHPNDLPVNRFQRQIDLCIVALTSLLVSSRDSPMFASTHNYI